MTLASDLAHTVCPTSTEPGGPHDPSLPLVLGDQAAQNYAIITWDPIAHRVQIQAVYQPPTGLLQQATLTLSATGQLLLNGGSIANIPEIQQAVQAAQAAAAAAAVSQADAEVSAATASSAASASAVASNISVEQATLSQQFAQAPEGTPLPGGGDSSYVSAQKAAVTAQESRDLDILGPMVASETFQSGFLFSERQAQPAAGAALVVTIPPGIFSSSERKAQWATYKLRAATGSVQFVPQSGGTNLVTPSLIARNRVVSRILNVSASARRLLTVPIVIPTALIDGEILLVFNAQHQGPLQPTTVLFNNAGGLTWNEIVPFPANARAVGYPDFWVVRARVGALAAGQIDVVFDEGTNTHLLACDYFVLDNTEGTLPLASLDVGSPVTLHSQASATLAALPAQSLVIAVSPQGAAGASSAHQSFSANISRLIFGNTSGQPDILVSDADALKNQVYGIGSGVSTASGNFAVTSNFSASSRTNMVLIGYIPKSVPGGGTVVLNKEGGRDTLNVPYGTAELWFQNDGVTVDLRTPAA